MRRSVADARRGQDPSAPDGGAPLRAPARLRPPHRTAPTGTAALVVAPEEVDLRELADADVTGFGAGVFYSRLHPRLTHFVKALPTTRGRAFVFATRGLPELPLAPFTRPVVHLVKDEGYEVDGSFSCRAFDTWTPFKLLGGINTQRPNTGDLAAARAFAERVRDGRGPVS